MRFLYKSSIATISFVAFMLIFTGPALAATTPYLGAADTFNILSSTYTNTVGGTTISEDLGYTIAPAVDPTVGGTTHIADATYNQAGIDQGVALNLLNAQPCTFTFAPGAIDLATDTTHGPIGVYTPGVYCITGAATFGSGTTTLTGGGTYIFRMDGALTTAAGTTVTVADGASPCNVFWTPTEATTLGANSTFVGTDIDAAGIAIGSTVNWTGRALAFGGTVSTDTDTLTMPICSSLSATLRVVKQVVNDSGGTAIASDFDIHVMLLGIEVIGSPAVGVVSPGTGYSLFPGTYVVSEDTNISYAQSFSGDCDSNGNVILEIGDNKTCTITNNDYSSLVETGGSITWGIALGTIILSSIFILASTSFAVSSKKKQSIV